MLIASIIHDFAYKYGFLLFKKDEELEEHAIGRRDADRLFHDTIATVSISP